MSRNFVFISPNFPENYWRFCKGLKDCGMNVLGIGEQPYDELSNELKDSLNEYYKVNQLENYDEVYRAVAFFTYKYGKIEWLESNNEYWLERDASLRTEFNITTGYKYDELAMIRHKSQMKQFYEAVNIPVARYHLVDDYDACINFINEVGYPVIVKPDNGVGAFDTHRLDNINEVDYFFATKDPYVSYIMEEFIYGVVDSYDAIILSNGEPAFETGTVSPTSIMDIVNDNDNAIYHVVKELPDQLREFGRAAVKSFNVHSRFIHFEFFRLTQDQHIGKEGDYVALEVNMRPCGGITPDMMNYANSCDVYNLWAQMIAYDSVYIEPQPHYYCAFAGRRDGKSFRMSHEDLYYKYAYNIVESGRVEDALASTMGNYMYLAKFEDENQMNEFYHDAIDE